jgi:hypothetical protein
VETLKKFCVLLKTIKQMVNFALRHFSLSLSMPTRKIGTNGVCKTGVQSGMSMVMSMVGFDNQSATFAFPGATLGAMGASAMSSATGAEADEAAELREAELQASYRSAAGLGFDELIDPRETRIVLLDALQRAVLRRQIAPEPVLRAAIVP